LTSAGTNEHHTAPPPPAPAEITCGGQNPVSPLAQVSFRLMCGQVPAALGQIAPLRWRTDRRAGQMLLGWQAVTGASAAVLLTATVRGSAGDRLHAAAAAGGSSARRPRRPRRGGGGHVRRAAGPRIRGRGFSDRHQAAGMGVIHTQVMVTDATRSPTTSS
jgi:ATP-binding cassette subfamily B protein/ATP-binding cassette subfamily C protein